MKPSKNKSILNPAFKYSNSAETDLRKTFARVRREMAKAIPISKTKVVQLRKEGK